MSRILIGSIGHRRTSAVNLEGKHPFLALGPRTLTDDNGDSTKCGRWCLFLMCCPVRVPGWIFWRVRNERKWEDRQASRAGRDG